MAINSNTLLYGESEITRNLKQYISMRLAEATIRSALYGPRFQSPTRKQSALLPELHIEMRTPEEVLLVSHPDIARALGKLRDNLVPYQTETGRAAMNVKAWIQKSYIDSGIMTKEEFESIPIAFIRSIDSRLYHAIFNDARKR